MAVQQRVASLDLASLQVPDLTLDLESDSEVLFRDSFIGVADPVLRPKEDAFCDAFFTSHNTYDDTPTHTHHQQQTTTLGPRCGPGDAAGVVNGRRRSVDEDDYFTNVCKAATEQAEGTGGDCFERRDSEAADGDNELLSWFEQQTDFYELFKVLNGPADDGGQRNVFQEIVRQCEQLSTTTDEAPTTTAAADPVAISYKDFESGACQDMDTAAVSPPNDQHLMSPMTANGEREGNDGSVGIHSNDLADDDRFLEEQVMDVFEDEFADAPSPTVQSSSVNTAVSLVFGGEGKKSALLDVTPYGVRTKQRRPKALVKVIKRQQNRVAAARYREKKRMEKLNCCAELLLLEKRNAKLRGEVEDTAYEIGYLRKLMKEIGISPKNAVYTPA